jgi:hypothetical protein
MLADDAAPRDVLCIMRDRQVVLELPELEQRLSNLQTQVERLWRKAEANVPPIEQRLVAMADQYAEYLKRWAATVERHTQAVSQLEAYASEWKDASSRVRQETSERLQDLESTIEREWDTLRRMQEEPIRQLREQAESLTQASLAMASASQQGVDRAEARFASFESEVHTRLAELTRELQAALAEMKLRLDRNPASRDPAATWSLDDVTRLHGQLRDGVRPAGDFPRTIEHPSVAAPRELSGGLLGDQAPVQAWGTFGKWARVAAIGTAITLVAYFGWRLQSQVKAATDRATVAQQKADAAWTDAAKQTDAVRAEAAQRTAEMREMMLRAQRISDVAAAPDLIRFNLSGADGASGQAMFSRSRGFVVNGWRLPPPAGGVLYQVWLLTRAAPVKAGTLIAGSDGSATLVQPTPVVPRSVIGVMVSQESSESVETPSGAPVLSSVATTAPAPTPNPDGQP